MGTALMKNNYWICGLLLATGGWQGIIVSMAFGRGNLNIGPIATGNLRLAVGKFPKEVYYLSKQAASS
jgi:hypothetical protein